MFFLIIKNNIHNVQLVASMNESFYVSFKDISITITYTVSLRIYFL